MSDSTTTITRQDEIEKWLSDNGVEFHLREVSLNEIDTNRSLRNQARFTALHDEDVFRYAEAMERGDQFPPTVVFEDTTGLVTIDGNHRHASRELVGQEKFPAYIVTAPPQILRRLTIEANAKHGLPPSPDERKSHAIFLVDNGSTHTEAARLTGLTTKQVSTAYQIERGARRAQSLGIKGFSNLGSNRQGRLASVPTDAAFVALTRFVLSSGKSIPVKELSSLIAKVRKQTSEQGQLAVINEYIAANTTKEPKDKGKGKGKGKHVPDDRHQAVLHTTSLAEMDPVMIRNQITTDEQRQTLLHQAHRAMNMLSVLIHQINSTEH